jgi:hypothetical protein
MTTFRFNIYLAGFAPPFLFLLTGNKMDLPKKYGDLSPLQRRTVRLEYARVQDGKCYFCKKSLYDKPKVSKKINRRLFPKNFFEWPVHLRPCHKSGLPIGAVHSECNAILWQYYGE